jgi:hypothetical protein
VTQAAGIEGSRTRVRHGEVPRPHHGGAAVPGVTARGSTVIKAHQFVGVNYGTLYAANYGGMRAEVRFIPETILVGVPPLPYVLYTPPTMAAMCYPSLTGRASVSLNATEVTVLSTTSRPASARSSSATATLLERHTPVDRGRQFSAVMPGRCATRSSQYPHTGTPIPLATLRASRPQTRYDAPVGRHRGAHDVPIRDIMFRNRRAGSPRW